MELIVLHAISLPAGDFSTEHVEALFMDRLDVTAHPSFSALRGLRVSPHFVVDRGGGLTQFVPTSRRAWHAGQSCWRGRERCNDFAIGIEMIGDEDHPFTPAQYTQTARLCRTLMAAYPRILPEHIVGHADIAPGRKWDPGRQWDWSRFHRSLTHIRRLDLEMRR